MAPMPIRVLLFAEESSQSLYLETILAMESPGRFQICHGAMDSSKNRPEAGESYDLCLVASDVDAGNRADAWLEAPRVQGTPTIVVSTWQPSMAAVGRLIRGGAEDVLGLAELSPRRLTAAVLKVLERQRRAQKTDPPARGVAYGNQHPVHAAGVATAWGLDAEATTATTFA